MQYRSPEGLGITFNVHNISMYFESGVGMSILHRNQPFQSAIFLNGASLVDGSKAVTGNLLEDIFMIMDYFNKNKEYNSTEMNSVKLDQNTANRKNSTLYCKGEKCVILAEVQFEARGLQCAEDKIASLPNVSSTRIICTMNNCESEEIVEAANIAISNLLPTKSRSLYDIAYNRFKKWCADKNVQVYSENVLLAYFSENAKNYKSSTLWAQYSMVNEIDRFLSSADDKEFLTIKYFDFLWVGLILGIAGACRTDELVNLTVDDIEDVGSSLITKIPLIFVVTDVGNMLELFRKYLSLRPPHVKHKRLFCTTKQENPVGKNTMGKIPSVVASYLKLPDVACYTGHCLRRSSATLLADAGVDITTIKRHAGWKSTTVAEGYVENSIENKTKIANQILVGTTTSAITKTVNVSESNIPSNINFENCTNVTFNLNVNK
ncbi:hypothetical protein NQ317_004908 [Molorchus minor]|uniref:Tyr recombinase domain-containing protein n=2 Tax=Molorchus minor TaxID=1323400 RepID=A0ABQ9JJS5_9CUCU|nr:hypothetical protein NQ317_004908 [Molorchus minor]